MKKCILAVLVALASAACVQAGPLRNFLNNAHERRAQRLELRGARNVPQATVTAPRVAAPRFLGFTPPAGGCAGGNCPVKR